MNDIEKLHFELFGEEIPNQETCDHEWKWVEGSISDWGGGNKVDISDEHCKKCMIRKGRYEELNVPKDEV